jgi:hypothetical protein
MGTETTQENFLLSHSESLRLLEHIAEVLLEYMRLSDLLRVYQNIDSVLEIKSRCGNKDLDDIFYSIFANNEDEWEKLLRKPFIQELAEIMKRD